MNTVIVSVKLLPVVTSKKIKGYAICKDNVWHLSLKPFLSHECLSDHITRRCWPRENENKITTLNELCLAQRSV